MWFILWLCLGLWYHVTTTGQLNDSLTRVKLTASASKADYERLVGKLQAGLSSAERTSQQHWATVEEQRATRNQLDQRIGTLETSLEGAADEAVRLKETVESLEATIESQKNDMEKQLSKRKRELLEMNRELKASCAKDAEDASERLKETEKTGNDFKSALDTCNRRRSEFSCPKCPACHRCAFF